MQIRPATPEDAKGIKQVHIKAYQFSYRGYLPDDFLDAMVLDDDVIERTKNYISKIPCYVATQNNYIIAFVYLSYPENRAFEINAIYVDPCYQKQGIGSKIVEYLYETKKAEGYNTIIVWTLQNGPSIGFYQKLGFIQTPNKGKMWKFDLPIIEFRKDIL